MFRMAGRLRVREEELRRARELGEEVDLLAGRAQRELEAMSETAMLRHDARNHLQVLRSLLEGDGAEGRVAEAAEYARTLARAWSSGEKDGEPDA